MAFRRHNSPDMNLNDVEFGITYQICQIFDIDRGWEQLAGIIGYSVTAMKTFELETRRPDGSPTKKILWDWGTRGGTARDLYNKLALMNKAQVMRLLDPIMSIGREKDKEKEKGVKDESEKEKVVDSNETSMMSGDSVSLPSLKVGNLISKPSPESLTYNPTKLPVPKKPDLKMLSKQDDVNINKMGSGSFKSSDEKDLGLKSVILPGSSMKIPGTEPGAASVKVDVCHTDGPGSRIGNEGAASSARPFERNKSFERVRNAIDYASQSPSSYMSQLSDEEKEVAIAMMATPNYTYKELSQATNGFRVDHKLGQGKFGAVYLGTVKNTRCAIKKLFQKQERNDEETSSSHVSAELRALSRYRHENIVTLYGYALDGDEVCLVYQFMPNGSLDDCLHQRGGHNVLLDWSQRLNILRHAACGLQFLHSIDKKPVIHGDIKSANILLDRHFDAKIGDLGLAQQATGGTVTGELTHITKKTTDTRDYKNQAYYGPEILRGNGFSVKGDTYAFGVVIFECLTGEEAYDEKREGSSEKKLIDYIESQLENEDSKMCRERLQDTQVKGPCPQAVYLALFELAVTCTQRLKKNRPTMVLVFQELERIGKDASLQETDLEGTSDVCRAKEQTLQRENSEGYMSYASNLVYPQAPEIKVETPAFPPDMIASQGQGLVQSHSQGDLKTVASPIDLLPAGHPFPEAFKLQALHDQKKQDDHDYQNVERRVSKISISDMTDLVSDPKKLAQLERGDSGESNNSEGGIEFKSDPKKVKAIEDFDKSVNSGKETERYPASDPKKVAMLMGQEVVASSTKAATEVEYENMPAKSSENKVDLRHEGQEQDSEGESQSLEMKGRRYSDDYEDGGSDRDTLENDDVTVDVLTRDCDTVLLQQLGIADKSQPKKAGMLALFENYDKDIGGSSDVDEIYDYDPNAEDDDSESTLTESTCMGDFGETELSINEDELFRTDSGGKDTEGHKYENCPPKKEAASTVTTTETISAHRKKVEFYQNMSLSGEQSSEPMEQIDESHLEPAVPMEGVDHPQPGYVGRAPTEDECYI